MSLTGKDTPGGKIMASTGKSSTAVQSDAAVRVVVVGAGFGGLSAMKALARSGAQVTLVDRNAYSTFQPLLYQVATAGLAPSDVAYPLRAVARRKAARFRRGVLAGADLANRTIALADGGSVGYDYLILATGVSAAFFGITGAAENCFSLYTRRDAIVLRNQLIADLEQRSLPGQAAGLAVTIVGGGATGIELAGTLADLRNIALPAAFPDVDPAGLHLRLIEQAPSLITPFASGLRDYAHRQLQARGVEVRLGTGISAVSAHSVRLADGADLASDITVWAAGVSAPELVTGLGLPTGHGGRVITDPDLRVRGQDRVFAVGDVALIDGQPLAQLAQPAIQQGRHAAAQIRRLMAGQPTVAFRYHDKGTMATIGRRSAVVQLRHLRFRGALAWFAWLGLHLVTLLGGRNQISALVNLSWRYLTWKRTGGVLAGDEPAETGELPGASEPAEASEPAGAS
jgi:NADH dehydrogenase